MRNLKPLLPLTLWVASPPKVRVTPLRMAFSQTQDQIQMAGWPEPRG